MTRQAPLPPLLAVALLVPALLAPAVAAADGLKTSGSVRARYEGLSGQSRAGFKSGDELLSFRTILSGEYDAGLLRFGAELTDSRAYRDDARTAVSSNDVNALEPTQFYVALDVDQPFGKGSGFSAQAGRFTMNIGSRRLIANDDYRNAGTTQAGVRLDGKAAGWSGTTFYVLPSARLPEDTLSVLDNDIRFDRESAKAVMWGGLVTSPRRVAGGAVDVMFVKFKERDAPTRPTRDRDLDTWNLRWFRDAAPGQWDYEFETAVQHGRARTGTGLAAPLRPVDASFVHGRVGYQWSTPWKPRLAVEYDWVSGDTGPDRIRRYDTLFGFRRGDFAPSGLYNQVARANVSSPALRLEATPSARVDFMGTWRPLFLASRTDAFSATGVRDASGRSGRFAGSQFDARVRYWVVPKRLRVEFDGVLLAKDTFLETAPNARPGDTRFYSLNLTASF
jgi:hypothetical protein